MNRVCQKKYNVIYADPPWHYNSRSGNKWKHGADAKYETLTNEEIKSMDIPSITQDDAVLFLWATVPMLDVGFDVLKTWGFKYKTMLTWRKVMSLGMGFWFRIKTEHLLFGVSGNVKAFRLQKSNFYQCKAGRHSAKPDYFRQLITTATDKFFAPPTRLELFARSSNGLFKDDEFNGWDIWGNEARDSVKLKLFI